VPWTPDPPGFGFTSGKPWLPMPAGFGARSVAAQDGDAGSTLALFRAALAQRPTGDFAWRDAPEGTLSFMRGDTVCLVNVAAPPLPVDGVLIRSDASGGDLPAGAAAWLSPGGAPG
jgi:alpha-glucosidase